ncbi:hypothetical protein VMCG_08988 [Cytospora schulzeri]|uniref:Uncharacterized protein n=1 Tax=Cytospora schulzeri TaxID=448051 RepID=A0A423VPV5_9PEZI|nr:hypothetical protein VMCG_08988 [Valsa malicola]
MSNKIGTEIILPISPPAMSFGVAADFFTSASSGEPRSLPSPFHVLGRQDVKSVYIVLFEKSKLVVKYGDFDEVRPNEAWPYEQCGRRSLADMFLPRRCSDGDFMMARTSVILVSCQEFV